MTQLHDGRTPYEGGAACVAVVWVDFMGYLAAECPEVFFELCDAPRGLFGLPRELYALNP